MRRDNKNKKVFVIPFHLDCEGHVLSEGIDYRDAMIHAYEELNTFNIDQTHLDIYTLDDKIHEVELDDVELDYEQKENIESTMDATI